MINRRELLTISMQLAAFGSEARIAKLHLVNSSALVMATALDDHSRGKRNQRGWMDTSLTSQQQDVFIRCRRKEPWKLYSRHFTRPLANVLVVCLTGC